jgi:Tubulin domain
MKLFLTTTLIRMAYGKAILLGEAQDCGKSDWSSREGNTSTHTQPVVERSAYQKNLDQGLPTSQLTADQVRYWSDFNRVFYHPRSIVQLSNYEMNSQLAPFESWNAGQHLFEGLDKQSDLLDRDIRPFAEECDQLAAIQIFASTDDAWGGFSSSYLDVLRDEFGKSSIWLWGLEDGFRGARVGCASVSSKIHCSCQAADRDSSHGKCGSITPGDGTTGFCNHPALQSSHQHA